LPQSRIIKRKRLSSDYTAILQYGVLPLMAFMYITTVFLYFLDITTHSAGEHVVSWILIILFPLALAFLFNLKNVYWDQENRVWTYNFLGSFKTWDIDSLHIVLFPLVSYGIGIQPVLLRSNTGKLIFFLTRIKSPLKREEHNIVLEFRKRLEANE